MSSLYFSEDHTIIEGNNTNLRNESENKRSSFLPLKENICGSGCDIQARRKIQKVKLVHLLLLLFGTFMLEKEMYLVVLSHRNIIFLFFIIKMSLLNMLFWFSFAVFHKPA